MRKRWLAAAWLWLAPMVGASADELFQSPIEGRIDEGFFKDATGIPARLKERIGGSKPIMARGLLLYRRSVQVQAQDPKNKENVDSYQLQAADIAVQPVSLTSSAIKDLDKVLFGLEAIDFALVPRLIKDALDRSKIADGNVTHLALQRGAGSNDVRWQVFVSGARRSLDVVYDAKGAYKTSW